MNTKTIQQANSADLRGSWHALQRAARRARELAAQTGTDLIVSRDGVITRLQPLPETVDLRVRESVPSGQRR